MNFFETRMRLGWVSDHFRVDRREGVEQTVNGHAVQARFIGVVFRCHRDQLQSCHGTGQGRTFQISAAYSAMDRSLENLPDAPTFKIVFRVHSSGLTYNAATSP